ncbi:MAG: MBL fold metallo-hydrolase [Thermoleophilaceae bacterium]|nr:MBL fold metallo-hydrolase [Thermoleophilaceae bacterium]
MRAVSIDADALVLTSRIWQTNATVLRCGAEALLIDSPYLPDELELLPSLLGQAGFEVDALLATHADFDHLLGRLAFPDLALGVGESTALRLRAGPGAPQRALRGSDGELYLKRPRPLSLGAIQSLPVPGRLELGAEELELHSAPGHTADGTSVFAPWLGVLVAGDYLSDVELPMISPGGSLADYRATLEALIELAERATTIVPGHGSTLDREAALKIGEADLGYLAALERSEQRPPLPKGRDGARQRQIHEANLREIG